MTTRYWFYFSVIYAATLAGGILFGLTWSQMGTSTDVFVVTMSVYIVVALLWPPILYDRERSRRRRR